MYQNQELVNYIQNTLDAAFAEGYNKGFDDGVAEAGASLEANDRYSEGYDEAVNSYLPDVQYEYDRRMSCLSEIAILLHMGKTEEVFSCIIKEQQKEPFT